MGQILHLSCGNMEKIFNGFFKISDRGVLVSKPMFRQLCRRVVNQCEQCKHLRKTQKKYPELDIVYGIGLGSLIQQDVNKNSDAEYWDSMSKANPILHRCLRRIYDYVYAKHYATRHRKSGRQPAK